MPQIVSVLQMIEDEICIFCYIFILQLFHVKLNVY